MSNDFYNQNATPFFNDTVNVDLSNLYKEFLPLLTKNSHILDAGCGSGRDTLYFIQQGYQVTAFDASAVLALKASEHAGVSVSVNTFENYQSKPVGFLFDAIWACASLLHVPSDEISHSFDNLAAHLKSGGIFYCSFKYGNNDITKNGRSFTNADEARLSTFIASSGLTITKTWISSDVRPDRHDEKWLNAILIKV